MIFSTLRTPISYTRIDPLLAVANVLQPSEGSLHNTRGDPNYLIEHFNNQIETVLVVHVTFGGITH